MSDPSSSPQAAAPIAARVPFIRRRRTLIAGATLVLLALAGGGWYFLTEHSAAGLTTTAGPGGGQAGGRFSGGPGGGDRVTPIVVEAATSEDFPVRLSAIGTVVPRTIVTVRSRVDGTLDRILFEEGQSVKAGDLLAEIDPRSFEVALAQTQGQMLKDQALLANARADLSRYEGLARLDAIPTQQLDTQRALVRQYEAAVKVDQGVVDNARLQLSYTRVTAPTAGRVGLRQVDPGNLVRASDANGIVVITQVQPVTVVFPIPEAELGKILAQLGLQTLKAPQRVRGSGRPGGGRGGQSGERATADSAAHSPADRTAGTDEGSRRSGGWQGQRPAEGASAGDGSRGNWQGRREGRSDDGAGREQRSEKRGATVAAGNKAERGSTGGKEHVTGGGTGNGLVVEAWDRDGRILLATGELLTVDNQIDITTGTVKVKAIFPNKDGALFPNQFVNVRLVVSELKDATVIPTAAVQRGAKGTFVWLLNEDKTVALRQVDVGTADGDLTPVLRGLKAGEQVAVDGFDRLREGAKVEVVSLESRAVKEGPGKRGGRRGGKGGTGGAPATSDVPGAAPAAPGTPPAANTPAATRPQS